MCPNIMVPTDETELRDNCGKNMEILKDYLKWITQKMYRKISGETICLNVDYRKSETAILVLSIRKYWHYLLLLLRPINFDLMHKRINGHDWTDETHIISCCLFLFFNQTYVSCKINKFQYTYIMVQFTYMCIQSYSLQLSSFLFKQIFRIIHLKGIFFFT